MQLELGRKNKTIRYSTKKGINLIQHGEDKDKLVLYGLIALLALVVVAAVVKFGVIDQIARREAAQANYDSVHAQYLETQRALENYDKVLLEYRTYSMDWMEGDESGRYVNIQRKQVLDMIEEKVMPLGVVKSVLINDNRVEIMMSGMNLSEISAMCADIEDTPFVASANLRTAETDTKDKGTSDDIWEEAAMLEADLLTFTIQIRLQNDAAEG